MEKDAEKARKNRINYDMPLLVDGESRAECEPEYMSEEERLHLIEQMKSNGAIPEDLAVLNGPIGIGVSTEDNHIKRTSGDIDTKSFLLSRTVSTDEHAKPEHAAKGFTWYIREAPAYGSETVAFFKDVRTACSGLELLTIYEGECQQAAWEALNDEEAEDPVDYTIEHDLNWLRRLLVSEHEWELLSEL